MASAAVSGPGFAADDPLESAVHATVAYSDVFGYAPTRAEIHRYLLGLAAEPEAVARALEGLVERGVLLGRGGRFVLAGRDYLFAERERRAAIAQELWPRARRYARWLATIPTVRMVGVTGSLAVDNPADAADIDFMLIVAGGSVWRTRALAKLMQQIDQRLGGNLCVNYLRSERALELPAKNLYIARELAQMVPLYGQEAYAALRAANAWILDWLPNAAGPPERIEPVRAIAPLRRLAAPLLSMAPARILEDWESRRKIARYNDTDFLPGRYSEFSAEATGHRLDVKDTILAAHQARLAPWPEAGRLRVMIGQAYHLAFDPKLWSEMRPYPPLGSLYAAAVVRRAGHEVSFFDAMLATELSGWISALDRNRPEVVVLFEDNFNYLTKMCLANMRTAAFAMIEAAQRVGATVVVCSSDATDHAAGYLEAGAKVVIRGEGETALLGLLEALASDTTTLADVPGISYRDTTGKLCTTARLPALRALDELPFPAWDLVDLERYARIWRHRHGRVSINLATTRGCPYHCNWCSKPIWGQGYNVRSPENVADELAYLSGRMALEHVWFMDDIFGLKPNWVARLADGLEARGLTIRFKCLTRPDLLRRPGEVEALQRAGCETVWIGAESGSQKILDAMEKGTRVEQIEDITRRLKAAGIRVGFFVQFGYPGERLADVRQTLALLRRALPDELGISVSYPLPGTSFFERVKDQLGATRHWQDSDDLAMLFRGPYRTPFYRVLHRLTHQVLAWQRIRRQLEDGSWLRLAPRRRLRRLAFFTALSVRLPCEWLLVHALSLLPTRGLEALPVELDQEAAARPSPQQD